MTYESYEIAGKQLKLTAVISRVFKSCIEVPVFKACEDFGETNSGDSQRMDLFRVLSSGEIS